METTERRAVEQKFLDPWGNGRVIGALQNLERLSKIGSKHGPTIRRLVSMIRYARTAVDSFYMQRDALTQGHAKRDAEGAIVVRTLEKGEQTAVMENEVEYQLALNNLLRQKAELEGEAPTPFKFADFFGENKRFKTEPEAELIAGLGPFVDMTDTKET
jgi:hypothetical protein